MSDRTVAEIARDLAEALVTRARTRLPEHTRRVLTLQADLCMEVAQEMAISEKSASESLILN